MRDAAAKIRKRKSFEVGDHVIVYDNHQKLSYNAIVSEILGTNNYIVISDNGDKHVSGDNLSRAVEPTKVTNENIELDDVISNDNDDASSVISDFSDDFELLTNTNNNIANNVNNNLNQPRRGIRELRNLGEVQRLPRLRLGRN